MNPYNPDSDPIISSRSPYLPPATPGQALQAVLSPASQDYALMHGVPLLHGSGLAQALANGGPLPTSPYHGLAKDLQDHGITSWPDADPRLVNVTTDPSKPAFQTAGGATIQMNKPYPYTTLPWGQGVDRLVKFADGTGAEGITITGGTETAVQKPDGSFKQLHSANSLHGKNGAIDMRPDPNLSDDVLKKAAMDAGYTHGIREIKGDGVHLHFQVGSENIKGNPGDYDLSNPGPISVKDYTKQESDDAQGVGGN